MLRRVMLADAGAESFSLPLLVGYVGQVLNPTFSPAPSSRPREPSRDGSSARRLDCRRAEISLQRAEAGDDNDVDDACLETTTGSRGEAGTMAEDIAAVVASAAHPATLGAGEVRGCITLIARMAAARSGTRLWRKGLDKQV